MMHVHVSTTIWYPHQNVFQKILKCSFHYKYYTQKFFGLLVSISYADMKLPLKYDIHRKMLFMKYIAQILIFTINTQKILWSTIFGLLLLHFRFRHENTINVRKELFSLDLSPCMDQNCGPDSISICCKTISHLTTGI